MIPGRQTNTSANFRPRQGRPESEEAVAKAGGSIASAPPRISKVKTLADSLAIVNGWWGEESGAGGHARAKDYGNPKGMSCGQRVLHS